MKKVYSLLIGLLALTVVYRFGAGEVRFDQVFTAVTSSAERSLKLVEAKPEPELKILAFGDMMLGRYVRTLQNKYGEDYVFEKIDLAELGEGMDLVHANLEGPIRGEGRSGGTAMIFAFNRDVGEFLARHGFDMVSIANNHSLDMGWEGYEETKEVLSASGVGFCGNPMKADGEAVYYGESESGMSYAFLCLHTALATIDLEETKTLIWELNNQVDQVIVSIHWGAEYKHTASEKAQVVPARAFVDSGADVVIGHHPHVVQNFEVYNGGVIFYSLGNFVFDQYFSRDVQEELAIKLFFDEDGIARVELLPMKSERSQSRLMTSEEANEWASRFIKYGKYDEEMEGMIRDLVLELP